MNYTTFEQSKHLLELGLKPETADLWYVVDDRDYPSIDYNIGFHKESNDDVPAWSVGQLLSLMPVHYIIEKTSENRYACYCMMGHEEFGKNPCEVAYKKMVWLLENNLV